MKKTMQTTASGPRGRKPHAPAAKTSPLTNHEDDWDGELSDSPEADVAWLEIAAREKETSRIRRQMEARRELERRLEEKRLRDLVEDWAF
jgi:hypothetical protein